MPRVYDPEYFRDPDCRVGEFKDHPVSAINEISMSQAGEITLHFTGCKCTVGFTKRSHRRP